MAQSTSFVESIERLNLPCHFHPTVLLVDERYYCAKVILFGRIKAADIISP
jgi:hypothetical protein